MQKFSGLLGYEFRNESLLERALTHRSWTAENPDGEHNERMEFLGDAVLQFSVTQYLYENFPQLSEGHMAKVRASCVSGAQLAEVARELGLGRLVRMGSGEAASGGRKKHSILADAMEAVLAAVYLDSDIEQARAVVLTHWAEIVDAKAESPGRRDYKTRYQEVLAANGLRPEYDVIGSGPDHRKHFVATLKVEGEVVGTGEGRSKKEAQQAAARAALGE
jgi:ribonuclease-3